MAFNVSSQVVATPITLRAAAALPIAAGVTVPVSFDMTKLQNTLRVPIEITEMLVTSRVNLLVANVLQANAEAGSAVELNVRVVDRSLTQGFVPFGVIAPWDVNEDEVWAKTIQANSSFWTSRVQRRVIFSAPIRLRPGMGFSVAARRNVPALTTAVPLSAETVSIAFIGRVVPGSSLQPTAQDLPYWIAATLNAPTTLNTISTVENDLKNGLDSPLSVSRVISHARKYDEVSVYATSHNSTPSGNDEDALMTLRWPNGDLINDTPVYMQSAFIREHAMSGSFSLPAASRVNLSLEYKSARSFNWLTSIALFGTRREVL